MQPRETRSPPAGANMIEGGESLRCIHAMCDPRKKPKEASAPDDGNVCTMLPSAIEIKATGE
jgi:hypothetical protein